MAATRSAVAKAEEKRISQIGDFKERIGGIIELPSGLVIRWRNPGGLRAFMSGGNIPNLLLNTVEKSLKGGKGVDEKMAEELVSKLAENPEMLDQMMDLYDEVALKCFVEPRLHRVPTWEDVERNNQKHPDALAEDPEDLRYDDKLYVDELPDDDKAFLFQLISGGTKDLATFREQLQSNMDALAAKSSDTPTPKRSSRTN